MKRDIQIKLKAVSADHCAIAYNPDKGWTISERGKDRASSNGTYVFLKTLKQMRDHMPSDLIPLHDGMIISFVNYELRVRFEDKTPDEVLQQTQAQSTFFAKLEEEIAAKATATAVPASSPTKAKEQPVAVGVPIHPGGDGYVAEQVEPAEAAVVSEAIAEAPAAEEKPVVVKSQPPPVQDQQPEVAAQQEPVAQQEAAGAAAVVEE